MDKFLEELAGLDPKLFAIDSDATNGDRETLLSLQVIVRNFRQNYVYLEVGSHIGGSLLPHMLDPLCRHVFSIDKRPPSQPDERGLIFDYRDNSTQRMIATLERHVCKSALLKLTTFDCDITDVVKSDVPLKVDMVFIDAEHTNVAVFRDFLCAKKFISDSAVVSFHDSQLVFDGILNIEAFLRHQEVSFKSFFLPDRVYTILFGDFINLAAQPLQRLSLDREKYIHQSRLSLWKYISQNAAFIEGEEIPHYR